jgi:aryl-alcohol dehydrogenase-like predicted oxidoreductase
MRILGQTGLEVSELCLGTGTFGGKGIYKRSGEVTQNGANEIVAMAMDAGINFFDTAEIYSEGLAEEILGSALAGRRKDAILITKVAPDYACEAAKGGGLSRKRIIDGCERSLKRLRTDYIDVYEIHVFDPETPLEETIDALDSLVRQGKVRYTGCSNFSGWQIMKSLAVSDAHEWARFRTLEAKYSLMTRELENELIPVCLDQGVGIVVFSPLYGGFLSGKYARDLEWPVGTRFPSASDTGRYPLVQEKLFTVVDELRRIAVSRETTVPHVALNYLLRKPGVSSLIIGVRDTRQLADNLNATDWELTPDEVAALDRVSEPPGLYPYSDQKIRLNTKT